MYRDFVALVEPLDDAGSALIKKLENPRHDEVSAEFIPDPAKRAIAKKAMTALAKAIREIIKTYTAMVPEEEVSLDEMGEFFADGDRGHIPPPADTEDDLSTIRYQPAKRSSSKKAKLHGSGKEGGSGGRGTTGGGGGGTGAGAGRGSGGTGQRGRAQEIGFQDVRHTRSAGQKDNARTIHFTPTTSGVAKIVLEAIGINDNEKLFVTKTTPGNIVNGELLLPLEEGKRVAVAVELSEGYDGPIEMSGICIAGLPGEQE